MFWIFSCNKNEPKPPISYSHPCPGLPTVSYEGKTYQTIQIGSQCWLRENLNVGIMVQSITDSIDHSDVYNDGIIEKYCYENIPAKCDTFGGMYDWDEMMKYSLVEKSQGICPPGFHIPSYDEIDVMVNLLGGYLIAGKKLSKEGTLGFDMLFNGDRGSDGGFFGDNKYANIWSSTTENSIDTAYCTFIEKDSTLTLISGNVQTSGQRKVVGHNVRCIKD
jgi:uncharacterized protein (TIGR02145 family)